MYNWALRGEVPHGGAEYGPQVGPGLEDIYGSE